MTKHVNHLYEFGSVTLDAANRLLYKNGALLPVQPRVIETLIVLVENAHAIVDKETIIESVWPDVVVEEGGLKRNISLLRKALGEEGSFIETLAKRGYRFTAEVRERWEEAPLPGAEGEDSELVLERRASLRITQEEEISDANDPIVASSPPETVVQPTLVSQSNLISLLRRHRLPVLAGSLVVFAAALGVLSAASRTRTPEPAAPIKSLAVLPFRNLASQGEDAHLGIGLADALITRLSSLRNLRVRPTSAVLKFDKREQDAIAAGQMLGVDAVLEGSVYRAGDRVRVTARLVRLNDHTPVWAGQFDEKVNDFLSIQNSISQRVAGLLALSLSTGEKEALSKRYIGSEDAYQLYAEGRYYWNKRNYAGMTQAESLFRQAIEKDPNFALAYLGLADTLSTRSGHNESLLAINKALELDAGLGEAYASRGFWRMFRAWQWEEAEADFKRAIELKPGYGTAHQWYATLLAVTGRVEEAKAKMRRALEIDPTSHNFLTDMGQMHYFAREYDEAERYCRRALEIDPDFVFAHHYLLYVHLARGEDDKAFEEMIKADREAYPSSAQFKTDKDMARIQADVRETYRQSGFKGVWRMQVVVANSAIAGIYYSPLVYRYTLLGEKEAALGALEKCYDTREFMLPFINIDPVFDDLRAEPRFQAVMRKMNLSR